MRHKTKIRQRAIRAVFLCIVCGIATVALASALVLASTGGSEAQAISKGRDPSHMDDLKNPQGCAGCHAGTGLPGTPLLKAKREELCFRCHGSFSMGRGAAVDIQGVLQKVSVHPIFETSHYHVRGEVLPESESSIPRHVACADCHVTHRSSPEFPWAGSKGYRPSRIRLRAPELPPRGMRLQTAVDEYEMCYLCHSESTNLPPDSTNISELMDAANPSYHPVEMAGRNNNVPSLVRNLSITDTIKCSHCHGNNEISGPKGPHGSDYEPILVAQYYREDGPEDPVNYELCYMCHDRRSILRDESFTQHNNHIALQQTACFTCHDAHGSTQNQHLIEFNPLVVNPSISSGGPAYLPEITGNPKCFLECHGVDHNVIDVGGKPW